MSLGTIKKETAFTIIVVVSLVALFIIAPKSDELDRIYEDFTEKVQEKQQEKKEEKKEEVAEEKKEETKTTMQKFTSSAEFVEYLKNMPEESGSYKMLSMDMAMEDSFATNESVGMPKGGEAQESERHSETNVQVLGIDEPDIVKNDGKHLFISEQNSWRWTRSFGGPEIDFMEERMYPGYEQPKTSIVEAFPIENLKGVSDINKVGSLLLHNDTLIVFSSEGIYGFNVGDKSNPEKKWEIEYKKSNYIAGARLYKNKIYLITRTGLNRITPCPIVPLIANGHDVVVRCTDIYYPNQIITADTTFTTMIINPESGQVENQISFVGNSNDSIVYMSDNSLYLTYSYNKDTLGFFADFFENKCSDIVPDTLISKLKKVNDYDISQRAKFVEFEDSWNNYITNLDKDDTLTIENEITNRFSDYHKENLRDLEETSIIKIGLDDLKIKAQGQVPGKPLNQFSMDEYKNNLRIATTVGERWFGFYLRGLQFPRNASANDVYVMSANLDILGSITDLGLEEKIYSARFIGDKGYLVTFRQIDPFYILDLSIPEKPKKTGELKIPGYSGYLHPIKDNFILGIGKEDSNVKLSLFDVSNSYSPKEKDKYILKEYYTGVLNNHHAFLLDTKHEVFFLPAGKGGYIFSYAGDDIKLEKAIEIQGAKRAIYIDDYMYIIGSEEIVVLDENTWERVKELEI